MTASMISAMSNDGRLRARAYQLEMFQASMQKNIIVAMATGSGKTNVACLRIQAELERTARKVVWFMAPNTVLAEQQLYFLSTQMPAYQMRTLLGHDNVHLWHSQQIWDKALANMNLVVSTPQVLLDALSNAFIKLGDISLLVFDEAHHCQAGSPYARIMETQYHPLKSLNPAAVPHVLGLTASSRISRKTVSVEKLEQNLDAECCVPTESVEEYLTHVYIPQIVPVPFTATPLRTSHMLNMLSDMVANVTIHDDPIFQLLESSTDPKLARKFEKIIRKKVTPALKDLKMLYTNAQDIHLNVGPWAADVFMRGCVQNWHEGVLQANIFDESLDMRSIPWLDTLLAPLREASNNLEPLTDDAMSNKCLALISFLLNEYHEGIAVIIFVERRSTAFALTHLLRTALGLSTYRVFSFVGLAASRSASLVEVADRKMQKKAFADFRSGSQDICVATSVAEEGVDIQAVNLVIRYDDPKQFVSFLQSRGRARKQASKFVYFQDTTNTTNHYAEWNAFEAELEQEYQKTKELRSLASVVGAVEEISEDNYVVEATGAKLLYDNAVQHLQHFCASIGKGEEPIYILSGDAGSAVTATVYLPAQIAPELREARSSRFWLSEKSAKRDAAFQAYKALHKAGLVNDNLVPIQADRKTTPQTKQETRTIEMDAEFDAWHSCLDRTKLWKYEITVQCGDEKYQNLTFAIPHNLEHTINFLLSESPTRRLVGTIAPLGPLEVANLEAVKDYTSNLIKISFRHGSFHASLDETDRLPLLLLAEHGDQTDFAARPLKQLLKTYVGKKDQPLMIWRAGHAAHFIWHRSSSGIDPDSDEIEVTRITKLQVYTGIRASTENLASIAKKQRITRNQCFTQGAASVFGPMVLLLPSVLHFLAAALRAQRAAETVFKTIRFHDHDFLSRALLAKQASGLYNYENLEFLGDAYLKYRASLQMYHEHPLGTEGVLTQKTHALISNERLERAAEGIGLAQFITTQVAAQKHWKLPLIDGSAVQQKRIANSKLLADVVESVLGAALIDIDSPVTKSKRTTSLLQLLLPEAHWVLPEDIVKSVLTSYKQTTAGPLLSACRSMFAYNFQRSTLLQEAFTHSSRIPSHRTLDRLEFLGDAILDFVLKSKLFEMADLDAGRMTDIRHALASHEYLAYLALGISDVCLHYDLETLGKDHIRAEERSRVRHITDLILIDSLELRRKISAARSRYNQLKDDIRKSLSVGCFPWVSLSHIAAPKVCSDIIESLLAAIYFDSGGKMTRSEELLQDLGMLDLAKVMACSDNFEVRSPTALLHALCAKHGWRARIHVRKTMEASAEELFFGKVVLNSTRGSGDKDFEGRGCVTEDSAEVAVADIALQALLSDQSILEAPVAQKSTEDVEKSQVDADAYDDDEGDTIMI